MYITLSAIVLSIYLSYFLLTLVAFRRRTVLLISMSIAINLMGGVTYQVNIDSLAIVSHH